MNILNISNYFVNNNIFDTNKIIDPLTTIMRLSLLSFKEVGTKLCIGDNKITFQDPSYIQSAIRIYNRDNKENLHYLEIPINIACKKYLDNKSNDHIENIEILFEYAMQGLEILKTTYTNFPMICKSIDGYILQIKYYMMKQDDQTSNRSLSIENDLGVPLTSDKCKIYLQINDIWSLEQVKLVIDMLKLMSKADNIEKIAFYKSLETYLIPFDAHVKHKCSGLNIDI